MRTISGNTLNLLANKQRLEPVFILSVSWSQQQYQPSEYADRTITTEGPFGGDSILIPGKILSVSGFDSATRIDGQGQSFQVSIVLSDTDGSLKSIINNNDIHKKPASLYQWFNGMPLNEKFLIASGVISSPIIWDEGKRTLAFDIVSRLESFEIGYSAEEGSFDTIAMNLIGEPWPMIFGKVVHSPCMQLQEVPTAFTKSPFGIADPTINYEIGRLALHALQCEKAAGEALYYAALSCYRLRSGEDCNDDPDVRSYNDKARELQEQANLDRQKSHELFLTWASQSIFATGTDIITSRYVSQKFEGNLRVGNQLFAGKMEGEGGHLDGTPILTGPPMHAPFLSDTAKNKRPIEKRGFQFFQAGTQVSIASEYRIQWLASMIPGSVEAVWAYRNVNGLKTLAKVPEDYYELKSLDYNSPIGAAVIVELIMPLSIRGFLEQRDNDTYETNFGASLPQHVVNTIDWEDQIYVTFSSSVGPNPIDIMRWVINNYCPGMSIGSSFSDVNLENYEMNFRYAARPDAMQFLQDLAYQARCAIWVDADTFHIKYLPAKSDPVDTITLNDIVVGSLQLTTTSTEELVTKYTATWRPDYLPTYTDPVKIIIRHNMAKYGTQEESFDYFAYSAFTYVEKTATFWLIRKAMTWKIIRLKTFVTKLNLETFDTVTLNLGSKIVSNSPVDGIIQKAVYNSDDNTIDLEIWTPVRLGEMEPYSLAWPADARKSVFFPTHQDTQAGSGGGLNGDTGGTLPKSNSMTVNFQADKRDRGGAGDQTKNNLPKSYGGEDGDAFDDIGGADAAAQYGIGAPGYGDPFPSDEGDVIAQIEIRDLATAEPITPPKFDYEYDDLKDVEFTAPDLSLSVYPCRVTKKGTSKGGYSTYDVIAYRYGLGAAGVTMTGVKQCQIDDEDEIPPGTYAHVIINTWTKDGERHREATIQVPVWLA